MLGRVNIVGLRVRVLRVNGRLKGNFCFETVFHLSRKFLMFQRNAEDLFQHLLGLMKTTLRYFNKFAQKMRCKWYFRDEPTENFSEKPTFQVKSNWNLPDSHPPLEIFLSKLELFPVLPGTPLIILVLKKYNTHAIYYK